MKKALFVVVAVAISGSTSAQNTISDAICAHYQNIMARVVLSYRARSIPVSYAENVFESEKDVYTRVFLKQVTRETYANPVAGRQYIESDRFRQACAKTHRGY